MTLVRGVVSADDVSPVDRQIDQTEWVKRLEDLADFSQTYCYGCHDQGEQVADFDLESLALSPELEMLPSDQRRQWELVYKRMASHQMPPANSERPEADQYEQAIENLAMILDHFADQNPVVPEVSSLRRLTRTEYQNAIRDLLAVEVDASQWLPRDESSQGFDNITTRELSPALISRYLTAAQRISRLAVGRPTGIPMGMTVRLPADLTQESHLPGLPFGTRGGVRFRHTFAETGTYQIAIRLTRDRDEMVEGLTRKHDIHVLVDRAKRHEFQVHPPKDGKDYTHVDTNLKVQLEIPAGPHDVAVTFPSQGELLNVIKRQPFDAAYNRHRHPRRQPAIFEVSLIGPLVAEPDPDSSDQNSEEVADSREDVARTPSWRRIYVTRPSGTSIEGQIAAAEEILTPILRRAYRREVNSEDLSLPMRFFRDAIETSVISSTEPGSEPAESGASKPVVRQHQTDRRSLDYRFDTGIEMAIASILVNPHFLFRTETKPDYARRVPTPIDDFELASRLSFFLWSSLPDDELLDLASNHRLSEQAVLYDQVERMLADERSESLVTNFASQWLHLRNLDAVSPDLRQFPDFDENLRRAMRRETELLFAHVKRTDGSVLELIESPFTFLNQRLAIHYGIGGVEGSHFRRVNLQDAESSDAERRRGGILRHASILSVTSYATRTSPTIRGNWVLENLVGTPPPPPPANVPALKEKNASVANTVRERLALHRADPGCASCHDLIDPVGFALDQFDAVGRWRLYDGETTIDASGTLPDGTEVTGVADLERSLLAHPDQFVSAMTEKLLTFGLGRGVDYRDATTVRQIVRHSRSHQYRFSSLIHAIVESPAFRLRSHLPQ